MLIIDWNKNNLFNFLFFNSGEKFSSVSFKLNYENVNLKIIQFSVFLNIYEYIFRLFYIIY